MPSLPSGGGGEAAGGSANGGSSPKHSSPPPPQCRLPLQDGDTIPGLGGRRRRGHADVHENLCSKLRFAGARVEGGGGDVGASKLTTAAALADRIVANGEGGRLHRTGAGSPCDGFKLQRRSQQRRGKNLDSQHKDDLGGQSRRTHPAVKCSSSCSSPGSRHLARATNNDVSAAEPTIVSDSSNRSVARGRNPTEGRRTRSWSTSGQVIDSGPIESDGSSAVDLPSATSDDASMSVKTTHALSSPLGEGGVEKVGRPPPSLLDLAHRGIDQF